MKRKSHIAFATSCIPLCFISYPKIPNNDYINFEILNTIINNHNLILYSLIENYLNILLLIPAFIFYYIGAIFPDLDYKLKFLYSKEDRKLTYLYHRQITHSLILYIGLFFYLLYMYPINFSIIPMFFIFGVLSHLFGDMLTGSVPWFIYGHYGNKLSRIGITIFLPHFLHPVVTRSLPAFLNKNMKIFVILFILNTVFCLYHITTKSP